MTIGNDELTQLPSTWLWSKFGEIADIESRLVSPLDFPSFPHVAPDNIEKGTGRLLEFSTVAEDKVTSNKQHFFPGQILYSKIRPYLSKVVLSDFEGLCSADMYPISTILERQYLFRYMLSESFLSAVHQAAGNRVVLPKINQEQLNDVAVPIAPLPEQRRIVAKIEALQERSGRAAKALEEVGPLLEQFRQSILADAFSGRLTADWREKNPNVEPARELLARIRTERRQRWEQAELAKYESKGKQPPKGWKERYQESPAMEGADLPPIPSSWAWTSADDVCSQITDGEHIQPPYTSTGLPMLTAKHVRDGHITFEDAGLISEDDFSRCLARCSPVEGDLLIVSVGATTGRTALVPKCSPFALVRSVLLLKPLLNSELLLAWTKSPWCFDWMTKASGATAQAHLYITATKRMPVPVPPIDEQNEILRIVNKSVEVYRQIVDLLTTSQSDLTQLNQSILAKAFRGELVPQDPNDEPASELLARIRREREVSGDGRQGSGRKKKAAGKGNASESARPAKRSKRTSKAASTSSPDASANASPEPARPQRRRRRSSSNNEDASLVIRVLAEGGAVNIHADTSGPTVQFYTKSSGGGLLAEIDDIPEPALKRRESKRVANLSDLMDPDLALLHPVDINETYLPQLRDWYTWAAPQLHEQFENEFLEQAKSRWSEALQIEEPSTSQSATKAKRGRLFDA